MRCFFLKDIFVGGMWTIFKVFIEFVTTLLLFFVLVFFGREACGILAPPSPLGIELMPLHWKGIPSIGPPEASQVRFFNACICSPWGCKESDTTELTDL